MYTVSKGPSKFVAKARMGIPSHMENGSWEIKKSFEVYNEEFTNAVSDSKPVFVQLNNKKLNNLRSHETITPEHEEIVKFVSDNWSSVTCKSKEGSSIKNGTSTVYYHVNEPNSQLKGNTTRQIPGKFHLDMSGYKNTLSGVFKYLSDSISYLHSIV